MSLLRKITATIFLFSGVQAFAVTKPFTLVDCETLVTGQKGKSAISRAGLWLVQADLKDLELHRVDVSHENLISDHVFEGGDPNDEIPSAFKGGPRQDSLLSLLEQKAFGIAAGGSIKSKNIRARLKSRTLSDLTIETFDGDKKIGETTLFGNRARLGFQNRLQFYQSYWEAEGYETDIGSFFGDHGYVLLPSEGGFAFVFSLAAIEKPMAENEYLEFSIFSMRDCPGREALLMKDYIFPLKTSPSGSKNICLDDLGLKLVLPYKGED